MVIFYITASLLLVVLSTSAEPDCQLRVHFNQSELEHHEPEHHLSADVVFNFKSFVKAEVWLENVSLYTNDTYAYSLLTYAYLKLPLNVSFAFGKLNNFQFLRRDQQHSKLIKEAIIDFVWNSQFHDTSFLLNCPFDGTGGVENSTKLATFNNSENILDPVPDTNWTRDGCVSPAKNQDPCFTCWAFPASGLAEHMHFKKTGVCVELSPQFLIDCGKGPGKTHNCKDKDGWNIKEALEVIRNKGGIYSLTEYPWTNGKDQNCKTIANATRYCQFWFEAQSIRKTALHEQLKKGPVAAYVHISNDSKWHNWKSPEVLEEACKDPSDLNHVILIVGSGNYKGKDYYWIKNSWNPDRFGEKGFARLSATDRKNNCLDKFIAVRI